MTRFERPARSASRDLRPRGFTLLEMLIVIAVIAITAAFAVPAYGDYILRGRLTAGVAVLKATRDRLEIAYSDNRSYARDDGSCAVAVFVDRDSQFSFACTLASSGQRFTLTATGTGGSSGFSYSMDEAGIERTLGVRAGWTSATLPASRFILKRE